MAKGYYFLPPPLKLPVIISSNAPPAMVAERNLQKDLYLAACQGNAEAVRELLPYTCLNALNKTVDGSEVTALYAAAMCGYLDVVKTLLADRRIEVDKTGPDGHTPLYAACYRGNKEIVEALLAGGAKVNQRNGGSQQTVLHLVARSKDPVHEEILNILLQHPDIDVNQRNSDGHTAFSLLCQFISTETPVMAKLIKAGALPLSLLAFPQQQDSSWVENSLNRNPVVLSPSSSPAKFFQL